MAATMRPVCSGIDSGRSVYGGAYKARHPGPSAYIATDVRDELLQRAVVMLHRALDAPRHDEWPLDVAHDLLTRAGYPELAERAEAFASDREITELMNAVEAARR